MKTKMKVQPIKVEALTIPAQKNDSDFQSHKFLFIPPEMLDGKAISTLKKFAKRNICSSIGTYYAFIHLRAFSQVNTNHPVLKKLQAVDTSKFGLAYFSVIGS